MQHNPSEHRDRHLTVFHHDCFLPVNNAEQELVKWAKAYFKKNKHISIEEAFLKVQKTIEKHQVMFPRERPCKVLSPRVYCTCGEEKFSEFRIIAHGRSLPTLVISEDFLVS